MAVAYLPKFVLGSNNCFWSRGLKFIVKLDASGPLMTGKVAGSNLPLRYQINSKVLGDIKTILPPFIRLLLRKLKPFLSQINLDRRYFFPEPKVGRSQV